MGVGALVGAALGLAASGVAGTLLGMSTLFGYSVGTLWLVGAAVGAMYDRASAGIGISTPNYTIDPIRNTMSQLVPVPIAYGRVRVAGNIVMQRFENADRKTAYQHIVLSEGPIKAVGYSDIYVNDSPISTLTEVTKYVFNGEMNPEVSPYDPEGVGYPLTAYLALKITASGKVRGNPTVTTVLIGRDFDYPGKGSSDVLLGCETTGTGGFDNTNSYGYKRTNVASHCLGLLQYTVTYYVESENAGSLVKYRHSYDDRYSFSFLSNPYADVTKSNILTFPLFFVNTRDSGGSVISKYRVRVYPDSTNGSVYYDFNVSAGNSQDLSRPFIRSLPNGVAMLWEPRRIEESVVSGVMQIKIPKTLLPARGKRAKIEIQITWRSDRSLGDLTPEEKALPSGTIPWAGLLPYSDCLTDSPPVGLQQSDYGISSPAWIIYDLLTNKVYGGGIPADLIDVDSFAMVAARCHAEGIELNVVFDQQKSLLDHLRDALSVCRGFLIFRDKIYLGMDAPVATYTREVGVDDMIEGSEGSFEYWVSPRDQIPNKITVEYTDGDIDGGGTWERVSYSVEDWDDIDARGIYEQRYTMLGITRKSQAKAMANWLYESARRNRTYCGFVGDLSISDIEVGDVIAVTHPLPGWDKKLIRVVSVVDEQDCRIRIAGVEYNEVVYNTADDR